MNTFRGQHILPQDIAATVVSVVLVFGIIGLQATGHETPDELKTALGSCITWLFVRSAQQAERESRSNGN